MPIGWRWKSGAYGMSCPMGLGARSCGGAAEVNRASEGRAIMVLRGRVKARKPSAP